MNHIESYADALFSVARAEGRLEEVSDELFRVGQLVRTQDELRDALADPHIPAARRSQIIEELLSGQVSSVTVALASMVVSAGRARDLPDIATKLAERSAIESNRVLAEVRSAIELDADQRARLARALNQATGKAVDIKVIVDPTVMGGVLTTIGDTVIDGTVRTRLSQLREDF